MCGGRQPYHAILTRKHNATPQTTPSGTRSHPHTQPWRCLLGNHFWMGRERYQETVEQNEGRIFAVPIGCMCVGVHVCVGVCMWLGVCACV